MQKVKAAVQQNGQTCCTEERERVKLASVRMQTKCKTSSCCCCCCFHLPPRLHSFRGCSKPCESSAKSALKSLSDSRQETSPLLPRDPPPHQLPSPLDHLVGGGGDELPRAALLSWGGTLLVLVGGRTARGRWHKLEDRDQPAFMAPRL